MPFIFTCNVQLPKYCPIIGVECNKDLFKSFRFVLPAEGPNVVCGQESIEEEAVNEVTVTLLQGLREVRARRGEGHGRRVMGKDMKKGGTWERGRVWEKGGARLFPVCTVDCFQVGGTRSVCTW